MSARDERLAAAVALREGGDGEEARRLLLELRAEFPADARVALQTAWVHDSLGYEEEAVPHYRAALAGELTDEERQGGMLGLGSTLRTLGQDAESDEVLREASERFPDFRAFRVFRAMTLYNLGRPREAVRELIHVLLETTSDASVQRYRRALGEYAEDLDRSWLSENG